MFHSYPLRFLPMAMVMGGFMLSSTSVFAVNDVADKARSAQADGNPLQIGLSGLFGFGGSSLDNDDLAGLQAGGHDPNQNGFTVQNVELAIGATVDPYLDAQANIVFQIDADGETVVELEEAYFITRNLPAGLQVKGGQHFTEFGRQNKQHPHTSTWRWHKSRP